MTLFFASLITPSPGPLTSPLHLPSQAFTENVNGISVGIVLGEVNRLVNTTRISPVISNLDFALFRSVWTAFLAALWTLKDFLEPDTGKVTEIVVVGTGSLSLELIPTSVSRVLASADTLMSLGCPCPSTERKSERACGLRMT